MKMKNVIVLLSCILIIGIIIIYYCLNLNAVKFKRLNIETHRASSPDGLVDAVIVESDAGAMTSAFHLIFILPKSITNMQNQLCVLESNWLQKVDIRWADDNVLEISFLKGQRDEIYKLIKNPEVAGKQYRVILTEKQ
jgi:hypothetical protein